MSSKDAISSGADSIRIASFFIQLFGFPPERILAINYIVREVAHFIGFLILGGLVYSAARITWLEHRFILPKTILICSILALLDEVKKLWIPSRHLSWMEAGYNVFGVVLGVCIALFIFWILKIQKKNNCTKLNHR